MPTHQKQKKEKESKEIRKARRKAQFPGFLQFILLFTLIPVLLDFSLLTDFIPADSSDKNQIFELTYPPLPTGSLSEFSSRFAEDFANALNAGIQTGIHEAGNQIDKLVTILVSSFLLYPIAALICLIRLRPLWFMFGMAAPNALLIGLLLNYFEVFGSMDDEDFKNYIPLFYSIGTKISFLWFIIKGRLFSKSFLFFPIASLLMAILAGSVDYESFSEYISGFLSFSLFGATVGLCRALMIVVWQNVPVILELGLFQTSWYFLKATIYWLPLLCLALPAQLAMKQFNERILDGIYSTEYVDNYSGGNRDIEYDLKKSIQTDFQDRLNRVNGFITQMMDQTRSIGPQPVRPHLQQSFDKIVPPDLGLEPYEAPGSMNPFAEWGSEPAANYVLEQVENSYGEMRKKMRTGLLEEAQKIDDDLKDHTKKAKMTVTKQEATIKKYTFDSLAFANEKCQLAAIGGIEYISGASLLSNYVFWFFCVRSFLYVFGRVAFANQTKASISLWGKKRRQSAVPTERSSIRRVGGEYSLSGDTKETWYFARTYEPHGYPPEYALPQPSAGALGRIFNGVWSMNRIKLRGNGESVHFTSVGGAEFVEWNLKDGESVVFDYASFVGMSESTRLVSHTSLRISSLLMGRLVFPIAQGPGTIVLRTLGKPRIANTPETRMTMPPNRLVAWERRACFSLDSRLQLVDVYMSGTYVKPEGDACVILDADETSRSKNGLSRFIRYFLLPF